MSFTGKEMRRDMQNILVVEDDHDLNQAICYSLKKSGYESGAEEVILKTVFGFRNNLGLFKKSLTNLYGIV